MKMQRIIALSFVVLAAVQVFAVPMSISYVDGSVERKTDKGWVAIGFDDVLDSSMQVRLGARSVLELVDPSKRTIVICAAGTYDLNALLKAPPAKTVGNTIAAKIEKLAQGSSGSSAVMGVRGAAAESGGMEWQDDTEGGQQFYDNGVSYEKEGRWALAVGYFSQAVSAFKDIGDYELAANAALRGAVVARSNGSDARALAILRSADISAAPAELRASYALLQALLSANYGAVDEARQILNTGLSSGWFTAGTDVSAKELLSSMH